MLSDIDILVKSRWNSVYLSRVGKKKEIITEALISTATYNICIFGVDNFRKTDGIGIETFTLKTLKVDKLDWFRQNSQFTIQDISLIASLKPFFDSCPKSLNKYSLPKVDEYKYLHDSGELTGIFKVCFSGCVGTESFFCIQASEENPTCLQVYSNIENY